MSDRVHVSSHPLVAMKLTRLRSRETDAATFRRLLQEVTSLLLMAATLDLKVEQISVSTPKAEANGVRLCERVAFVPVLRSGLAMVDPALALIPDASVWHLGIRRDEETLRAVSYYQPHGMIDGVTRCFILDPTIATGGTAVDAIAAAKQWVDGATVTFVSLIAAPEGLRRVREVHPEVDIFLAAVDEGLNEHGYIVPGLGDVGDRLFGTLKRG